MKNKIEQRIKNDIGEWIATDGLMETLKIKFADTDATCFVREYVDDIVDEMGPDIDHEERDVFYTEMVKVGMVHAAKTFKNVMARLQQVCDTMQASVKGILA